MRLLEKISDLSDFICYTMNLPTRQEKTQEHIVLRVEQVDIKREVCYK